MTIVRQTQQVIVSGDLYEDLSVSQIREFVEEEMERGLPLGSKLLKQAVEVYDPNTESGRRLWQADFAVPVNELD